MSEFKGTKGKWEACTNWDDEFIEIGTKENQNIALVNKAYLKEFESNAKLIAAAPEMLDALIQLKNKYGEYSDIGKIAIEAIKKATE